MGGWRGSGPDNEGGAVIETAPRRGGKERGGSVGGGNSPHPLLTALNFFSDSSRFCVIAARVSARSSRLRSSSSAVAMERASALPPNLRISRAMASSICFSCFSSDSAFSLA